MHKIRQENRNAGDGDLQSFTANQAEIGRDKVNNETSSPNSQEASIDCPSGIGSSIPYPFDSQSSLENDNGSHGMYRNTVVSLSES